MAPRTKPFRLASLVWPITARQWQSLSDMLEDIYQRLKEIIVIANAGNQTITLTGDVEGSGTESFATTLVTVNADIGTFGSAIEIPIVTVNAKGQVTAVSETSIVAGQSSAQILARLWLRN